MSRNVYIDGEQIPDDRIRDIFRRPPGIPRNFDRSALIVGSRGAGKTTLFRYLKVTHEGEAVHLALAGELSTFAQDNALGPLAQSSPESIQEQVAAKASAILALSLTDAFLRKRIPVDRDLLRDCLPEGESVPRRPTRAWCSEVKSRIATLPLDTRSLPPGDHNLARFVAASAEGAAVKGKPLLLLLDRADMVVPAALRPITSLLDQSVQYVALVAMRPGHADSVFSARELGPVAGDHFGVVHIGSNPYDSGWQDFLGEALAAQLGQLHLAALDADIKSHVLAISRDSLRTGLELFLACRDESQGNLPKALRQALHDLRENQIVAAQRVLQGLHRDYRGLVNQVRRHAVASSNGVRGPVHVDIVERGSATIWEESSRIDALMCIALRSRAFCMPHGRPWAPGLRVRTIEIPPLVIWSEADQPWSASQKMLTEVKLSESELFSVGGPREQKISVFIAYRMDFQESRDFRSRLEGLLRSHPGGLGIEVRDGRVREGEDWAPVIRKRISRAKLVVADVTGVRNDVLFEVGFGFGLRKRVIPVVETNAAREKVPHWLRWKQIGTYESDSRLISVVSSIFGHLSERNVNRFLPSEPTPGAAVLLNIGRGLSEVDEIAAAFEREGFSVTLVSDNDPGEEIIRQATRAHVLVAPLSGGETDAIVHFICGDMVAREKVGYGGILTRRAILVGIGRPAKSFTAESLLRCTGTACLTTQDAIHDEIVASGRIYRKWMTSTLKGKSDAR